MAIACTPEELVEITNKRRPSAQIRALRKMGIEHRPRPDGTVFVHRKHVDHLLGAPNALSDKDPGEWEPNFG